MMFSREDIEILSPAGSFESLVAAIQGGANAIYFGIEQLNMRARSAYNFTKKDLPEIVSIARQHGIKTYLTVNTVIYNHELGTMRQIIDLAAEHEVNAIIASDQSVLHYARSLVIRIHLNFILTLPM